MLNEELEYRQYTDQMDLEFKMAQAKKKAEPPYPRIIPSLITGKNGAGIPRALWITARHELQEYRYWDTSDEDVRRNLREDVLEKMKARYAGDSGLAGFYRKNCESSNKSGITPWTGFIESKKKIWEDSDFYRCLNKNNRNETNLQRILCDAVHAGPLQNMAVICSRRFIDALKENFIYQSWSPKTKNAPSEKFLLSKDNTITSAEWSGLEPLLKLICAWQLKNKYGIPIHRTDLANWMNSPAFGFATERWRYIYEYQENGYTDRAALLDILFPEIQTRNFSDDELKKSRNLCGRIRDEYGLKLISADDISKQNGKDHFFICEEKESFGSYVADYIVRLVLKTKNGKPVLKIK